MLLPRNDRNLRKLCAALSEGFLLVRAVHRGVGAAPGSGAGAGRLW